MVSERQIRNRDGVRRVLIVTLSVHLLISATKLVVGYQGDIVSLQADGLHSLFDALSNLIGLFALAYALRPPDPEHPYGHRKVEVVASLAIGIMLVLALLEIARGIWGGLHGGRPPQVGPLALGVQCAAVVGALLISKYERSRAKRYDSMLLEADSDHTLSDALSGLAVIAGMLLVTWGIPTGDVIAAAVVMVFIGFAAYRVIRTVMDVMVDASFLDAREVCDVANDFKEVLSCHHVRSRGMQDSVHLDLHITLAPETPLEEAGEVMLKLKEALHRKFPQVVDILIQVEPHKPKHYQDVPEQLL